MLGWMGGDVGLEKGILMEISAGMCGMGWLVCGAMGVGVDKLKEESDEEGSVLAFAVVRRRFDSATDDSGDGNGSVSCNG